MLGASTGAACCIEYREGLLQDLVSLWSTASHFLVEDQQGGVA